MTPAVAAAPLPAAGRLPGVVAAALVAAVAYGLAALAARAGVVVDPLLPALLLGLAVAQLRPTPAAWRAGIAWSGRPLLRAAIVLSGLRLGLLPLEAVRAADVLALVGLVVGTLWLARRLGRALRLDDDLVWLLAAGHAVCGASAIAVADGVLRGRRSDVAAAIVLVTIAGTLLLVLLPLVGTALGMADDGYGFWVGSSVHEVGQALAAGHARGPVAGSMATLVKLARVTFLLPLGFWLRRVLRTRLAAGGGGEAAPVPVPWFVVGFAAVGLAAVTGLVPAAVAAPLRLVGGVAMATAMAGLGLGVSLRDLRGTGPRPLLLTALVTTFLVVAGFVLACWR